MRFRSRIAMLFAIAAVVSILSPRVADADLIWFTFSGTYDCSSTIFGESGSAVPYSYEMTYDTQLAPDPVFIPSGDDVGSGYTAAHDLFGYSASGVTAGSFVFGTKTWNCPADVVPYTIGTAFTADMWFDSDISVSTPTRSVVFLETEGGRLKVGWPFILGGAWTYYLGKASMVQDLEASTSTSGGAMVIESTIVPEPATFGLGVVAAAGFLAFPWRRRRSR